MPVIEDKAGKLNSTDNYRPAPAGILYSRAGKLKVFVLTNHKSGLEKALH